MPEPYEEAARDLVCAREDARGDLMRARHRLSKLLLRHGLVYDSSAWTGAHDAWLRRQSFPSRPLALAFEECYGVVVQTKSRRDALDQAIAELASEAPFADVVGWLCCLRGISTLTALALTVEIGDWTRFRPQSLGPFLGLVPSEDSSGERRRQGAITKTGNSHARRLLVEAAWHHRRPLRASTTLERRRQGQPAAVCARRRPELPPPTRPLARTRTAWQAAHDRRGRRRTRADRPLLGARDHVAAPLQRPARRAPAQRREKRPAVLLRAAGNGDARS